MTVKIEGFDLETRQVVEIEIDVEELVALGSRRRPPLTTAPPPINGLRRQR